MRLVGDMEDMLYENACPNIRNLFTAIIREKRAG